MKYLKTLALSSIILLTVISCKKNPYPGYDKTDNGLYYKFHISSESKEKPKFGDFLTVDMVYRTETDSIIYDSRMRPVPVLLPLDSSLYKGDILEGLGMLSLGDSATFIQPADSFFKYFVRIPVPEGIKAGSMLYFDIKLNKFQSQESYYMELQKEMESQKANEEVVLQQYIKDKNITVAPDSLGLYYIETKAGKGANPTAGSVVSVHYTGMLLNGQVFDSSIERQKPIEFTLGKGEVIRGWDEGISKMKKGGKATLVIPSHLAYGENGRQPVIPPFSTLVFEVELIDFK